MPYERIHDGELFLLLPLAPDQGLLVPGEDPESRHDWSGYSRQPYHGGPDHGGIIEQDPSLIVHWNKGDQNGDGWVQIELEVTPGWLRRRVAELDRERDQGGGLDPVKVGLFTDVIPRRALNRLREVIQRARNGAFGVDE